MVKWTSDPHTLQQDELWGEFDPPMKANKGDLIHDAHYLCKLPRARNWHCHASDDQGQDTKVLLKHVVAPNLQVLRPSASMELPSGCNKDAAIEHDPVKISNMEYDIIQDEIFSRQCVDYEQSFEDDPIEMAAQEAEDD